MTTPDITEFLDRAKQGNLVPVWRELLADQVTPLSIYARLCEQEQAQGVERCVFLFESVEGGEHIGRYSFIGANPSAVFTATGGDVKIQQRSGDVSVLENVDALDELRRFMAQFKAVPDPALPRFFGGVIGYVGYNMVSQFEPRVPLGREGARDGGLKWPDMFFALTDTLIIFDRVKHRMQVVANAYIEGDAESAYADAVERIDQLCALIEEPMAASVVAVSHDVTPLPFASNTEAEVFKAAVERTKEYIRAGDIIQAVLSQRFEAEFEGQALDVYRALRSVNPSPYMFCLEMGERSMVGTSPEIHVRCEEGHIEVRPIAGTRPRSSDPDKDRAFEKELLADPKEVAEHIMLVDLGRNDVGRVSKWGSVSVPELMVIERYSHVMHIVSDVIGELDDQHDSYDVLRATFPAGTLSGAPKIRAMEIIAELEVERRGPYGGAVGYFGFDGNLDSCITIRTILLEDGKAYVQAGAGIVADSDPQKELEETQNKARGMLKALAIAQQLVDARKTQESGS